MTSPTDTARGTAAPAPQAGALPVWRSLLYVPANMPRYLDKAHERGADALILDLEDSVPATLKDAVRAQVPQLARQLRRGGADVLVRVNRPLSACVRDIEASVCEAVDALVITKVDGAGHVRLLDELVGEVEQAAGLPQGHTRFVLTIETPAALARMAGIARASPRSVAMNIGGEDLALACGAEPTEDMLRLPKQQMILAARAAGLMPLGYLGSIADFADQERFRAMVRRSRQFGFEGASCVHPGQVAIVNDEYGIPPDALDQARRVLEGAEAAEREGRASFALDGRMVDIPVIARARQLLARHQRIEARRSRTD